MTGLTEQLLGVTASAGNILIPGLPALAAGASVAIWNYIGQDIAHSGNLVAGAPATIQLGTPVYSAAYAGCTPGATPNAFDSGVKDDNKTFSLLFAARHTGAVDAQASVPISNNDNSTSFGVNNSFIGTTGWQVATNASGINRTLAITGITNWKLYCVTFDDVAHVQTMYNLSDNTQDGPFTGTGSRNLSATGNWYIGANPRTIVGTRTCEVAFAALIKNQAVTLAQAQQYAAHIKAVLAMRGLTVP